MSGPNKHSEFVPNRDPRCVMRAHTVAAITIVLAATGCGEWGSRHEFDGLSSAQQAVTTLRAGKKVNAMFQYVIQKRWTVVLRTNDDLSYSSRNRW
jgi:hypothetical protein